MRQLELWPEPAGPAGPEPAYAQSWPCPGCGAKPGTYKPAERWRWLLGTSRLCDECARDREVVEVHLRDDRPPDPDACPYPIGSEAKIEWMARRAKAGLAVFQVWDNTWDPAPLKFWNGAPDHRHAEGETGVERCGKKWRARPFWRGKKWPLGVFPTEGEAIDRAREFWGIHHGDTSPPPVLWLPCKDEDGAIPLEREHLTSWVADYPGVDARRIAREYRRELRRLREKPPHAEVWRELKRRLAAAAGPLLFGADDSAELGV